MPNSLVLQAIIDVDLLGFVYHWGLEVNSITVIGESTGSTRVLCGCRSMQRITL